MGRNSWKKSNIESFMASSGKAEAKKHDGTQTLLHVAITKVDSTDLEHLVTRFICYLATSQVSFQATLSLLDQCRAATSAATSGQRSSNEIQYFRSPNLMPLQRQPPIFSQTNI
jgi:hypothetical protein